MLNKMFLLSCLILILSLNACDNQEAELVVQENQPQISTDSNKRVMPGDEESKPLITVTAADTVEILVRQDGAPGMYLGDDGKLHGFYVDLERMVMEEMGQVYHFVPYSDVGPLLHGLKSGIYHIALAAPDLPDYRSFLNLSIPYEVLHFVTFVHKKNSSDISGSTREELLTSLHGKKVGVQTQGHIYQVLREIREIELVEYPTTTKALEDLNSGLLDAVPDVKRIGIYYSSLHGWDIVPVGEPIISQQITTAFSQMIKGSLIERYNIALKALFTDGRFDALYESYFGPMADEDRPEERQ